MRATQSCEVQLNDAYCLNALKREADYLLSLDPLRLLSGFYRNAGLCAPKPYYGGWEGKLIGGHTMGHYLSALAHMCVHTGNSSDLNKRFRERLCFLVGELARCQSNSRGKEGFLWGAQVFTEENVEQQFDNVETGEGEHWVPWYTMHKLIAGLIDARLIAGIKEAEEVCIKLAGWAARRALLWDEEKRKRVLRVEYGGMNDCLYTVYKMTGRAEFLEAAKVFDEEELFNRILKEEKDYLDGVHANTTIPKILGALNGYTVSKEPRLLEVARKFFSFVLREHTYITGGNSENEHFRKDGMLASNLSALNCETCNTYNMLKLARNLFLVTGNKEYLDYYENTFINAILSSQNPETGMTTYFQPMAPGYFKVYSSPTENFWCCTGTGMENFSKIGDSIYYVQEDEACVSLYLSSRLMTREFEMEQVADLEHSNVVSFEVLRGSFTLRLRVPAWTKRFEVCLNGTPAGSVEKGFYTLKVGAGDRILLTLEKRITAHCLAGSEDIYAFCYGPYVLSAGLGKEDMKEEITGIGVRACAHTGGVLKEYILPTKDVGKYMENITLHMTQKEDGKFLLSCKNGQLFYSPHFLRHGERYAIYLKFSGEE